MTSTDNGMMQATVEAQETDAGLETAMKMAAQLRGYFERLDALRADAGVSIGLLPNDDGSRYHLLDA